MPLVSYRKKRRFDSTSAPIGKKQSTHRGVLRFVVQKHAARRTHFDFRLELDGTLKSWAVPRGPSLNPLDQRLAIHVEDHPLDYGSFEGVIPAGNYGAGTVMIWDQGAYEAREGGARKAQEMALRENYKRGKLTFLLHGKRLKGEFSLIKLKNQKNPNAWLLIKKRDEYARYRPDPPENSPSVVSDQTMDEIQEREVPLLTHPNKIFFPEDGFTKRDIFAYYEKISPVILPYLIDRPQSTHRQPGGIRGKGFYQKDFSGFLPRRIKTTRIVSRSKKKTLQYILCQDKYTLLFLANLGCIEFHPWLSRVGSLDHPDTCVLDIDPDKNDFDEVVQVAKEMERLLNRLGIKSFCKTSGATGLHLCIPLAPKHTYDESKKFAELVCRIVHKTFPNITSVERDPSRPLFPEVKEFKHS